LVLKIKTWLVNTRYWSLSQNICRIKKVLVVSQNSDITPHFPRQRSGLANMLRISHSRLGYCKRTEDEKPSHAEMLNLKDNFQHNCMAINGWVLSLYVSVYTNISLIGFFSHHKVFQIYFFQSFPVIEAEKEVYNNRVKDS
jgi:hypothetical protein